MKPSITLSMIVKNESHVIERCLNSVKPIINYWTIADTGSTDNTPEIIKQCMKDIPGELFHHEWQDFSTNRNLILNESKKHGDYTFIIDADDIFQVDDILKFEELNELSYNIDILYGNIIYQRPQLIHNSVKAQYIGVLHEYLALPNGVFSTTFKGGKIIIYGSGGRSKDPEKYYKDAMLFEKELQKDPNNPRSVFYCAQSWRDAGYPEKAIEKYLQRANMGCWIEEQYMSLIEAGKLMINTNQESEKIENILIRAYNLYSIRAESLYYLSEYFRKLNKFDKSYFYAKLGNNIKLPESGLFLEYPCYQWKLQDNLAIAAYYIGKKQEAGDINRSLLNNQHLPAHEVDRIKTNLSFC